MARKKALTSASLEQYSGQLRDLLILIYVLKLG